MHAMSNTVKLNTGYDMPRLGLGTYQVIADDTMKKAVLAAISAGYRHFDTAEMYRNEQIIGKALQQSPGNRNELFLTSKLWTSHYNHGAARSACDETLQRLRTDYIDLYLLHWPGNGHMQAWKTLIQLRKEGKCRSIGVSNFSQTQIESLIEETGIIPSVNQVEFSPFNYKKSLLEYSNSRGIILEAYSPLTRGKRFDDPTLQEISGIHSKTPAQILIRWVLQHDMVVIPKSADPNRIRENADVFDFELTAKDMEKLNGLDEGYSSL
mgnify:CR=1 FL=1